jgi:hypothetical protein|tara:strand:- start:14127 stop:14435 length:309 start_codon:yes stop_codon:yes gene_type:complete
MTGEKLRLAARIWDGLSADECEQYVLWAVAMTSEEVRPGLHMKFVSLSFAELPEIIQNKLGELVENGYFRKVFTFHKPVLSQDEDEKNRTWRSRLPKFKNPS